MKKSTVSDAPTVILALQDEIRRNGAARYNHRVHGVLLVAEGMSCCRTAELLGDAPRTVQNWVRRFEEEGLSGLLDGPKPGRPGRLSSRQLEQIGRVLRKTPRTVGMDHNVWDGKLLSAWIWKEQKVRLRVRQCQRIFHGLGFRLRKPRPMMAHSDPELQQTHKKTPGDGTQPELRALGLG